MQYIIVRDYTGREIKRVYGDFAECMAKLNEELIWQDGDTLEVVDTANFKYKEAVA